MARPISPLLMRNFLPFPSLPLGKLSALTIGIDYCLQTISPKLLNVIGSPMNLLIRWIWKWKRLFSHFLMLWYPVGKWRNIVLRRNEKRCLSLWVYGFVSIHLLIFLISEDQYKKIPTTTINIILEIWVPPIIRIFWKVSPKRKMAGPIRLPLDKIRKRSQDEQILFCGW